ncbi:Protein CBG06866 [Caenorhabditis briggsae]|uniref:Cytochrome b5 heme-binding domain-containing protein n=2 Tax=Caenorhabditis briggsae TaxID=6238 RepID=A0AAE9DE23_CAEBR|nr:Protein CBG06866 [Caenorhabditis briggsae]ULU02295.1 hypothetical protein L3Y34_002094 [Caenorhabditis briggsae]UMM24913.1 hypothetical protein L5515_004922 [Caenorhabditis briggsae]CAP27099.1 Protein CBG06866 [Caenorhabditis briggsae]
MSDLRIITAEEVAQHSDEDSCWIILHGKVYDVTKFLEEHPGGAEVITQLAGLDSTTEFDDVGHSKDAMEMAKEYLIGQLPESEIPEVQPAAAPAPVTIKKGPSAFSQFLSSPAFANIAIPTTMGIGIYVIYKCVTRSQLVTVN